VASYRVELTEAAAAQLRKIDTATRRRISARLVVLADHPRPAQAKPLVGRPGMRIRVGDYRVTYEVHEEVLLIVVLEIGHRPTVYGR
jgi:mRNA interferase RelE/StbE